MNARNTGITANFKIQLDVDPQRDDNASPMSS